MNKEQQFNHNIKERLEKYTDYNDFLKAYENHRDDHESRAHLFREEGLQDLNEKFGPDYCHY